MLGDNVFKGATLVVGPAGSGKTTWLRRRNADLIEAGERGLLTLVHSRRASRALSERIVREVGTSTDQVRVTTWHAFALSLLRGHFRRLGYVSEPSLLTGPEQFALVREMLRSPEEQNHWQTHRKQLRLAGFTEQVREFVLRSQDALESPEQLEERARLARREDLAEAARFFRRYLDNIDAQSLVDHANVIALAVTLLQEHDDVAAEVRTETRHLLVDDYQDVTPAQETLLRLLFVDGGSVAVAANPDARIFGFRGASGAAIDRYRKEFSPVREVALDVVHRAPEQTHAWQFDHLTEEADAVAREARRAHARDGVSWGDIAVVVRRYGATARAIRRAFERASVPYVVVGENRPLVNEPALVPMLDVARAALRDTERGDLLPTILSSLVCGLDAYDVRALVREARLRHATLDDLLRAPPEDLPGALRDALSSLRVLLDEIVVRNADERRPDGVFWFLWERLDLFRDMVARGDEANLDAVAAFARAIERFSDRRPGKTFADYLDVLEGVEFGPEPWNMPEQRRPDAVRILTAHQAAGDEFDVVFVAGAVEGEFPDARDAHLLIDVRDLLAPADAVQRLRDRLAEERRLWSVATTRARRCLVVSAARESSMRETLTPTPFLHENGTRWTEPPAPDEPLTRDEAEATYRRRLRDASLPEQERRDALAVLAALPGVEPDSWWYEREWTDPGEPLHEGEMLTSYSRLSPYENCGLQYLYQVEMKLDTEQTHNMLVGNWIHDIVDRCAKGELACDLEVLAADLDRVWNPAIFPSPAVEHRYRIESRKMLERWIKADGKQQALATEVEFRFPIEGAVLRGFIDRVVRCGGRSVRLSDYKTGSSAKSEKEIAEDLQLATYFLALKRDERLRTLGDPMYLELVFLATDDWRHGGPRRPHFDPRKTPDYEANVEERLVELVRGIRAERFAPKAEANCMWCKFKTLCPVWPEGDEVTL